MCLHVSVCAHVRVSEDNRPRCFGLKGQVRVFKEELCISHPWVTVVKWALVTQPESVKNGLRGPRHRQPSVVTAARGKEEVESSQWFCGPAATLSG